MFYDYILGHGILLIPGELYSLTPMLLLLVLESSIRQMLCMYMKELSTGRFSL